MAWNHPSFHLRHGGKKTTNPNAVLRACPYYNWKSSQKKAIKRKKKNKPWKTGGMRIDRRKSIKCSPDWDKLWTKETERNLDKVTSCHWGKKILKMSIKQVLLHILLLLSFEIRNNCTLIFAKQQNTAGLHYIPEHSQNFRGACNLLLSARWAEALQQPRRAGVLRAHGNCTWLHYSPQFRRSCKSHKICRHLTEDPISLFNYSKNSL